MSDNQLLLQLQANNLFGKLLFHGLFCALVGVFVFVEFAENEFLDVDKSLIGKILLVEVTCELPTTHEESFHDQEESLLAGQFIRVA